MTHESSTTTSVERSPQSVVCAGISTLVRDRWGRGPSRSRAYWAGRDVLVVMLEDVYTDAEETLLAAGHGAEVLKRRRLLAEIAAPELRRIAASATGRAVRVVLSQSSLEPALTVHTFVFEPGAAHTEPLKENLLQALANTDSARALLAEGVQARRQSIKSRSKSQEARKERRKGREAP